MARIVLVLALFMPLSALGEYPHVEAEVLEVLDGDTLRVRARIWIGHDLEILVRLNKIDAPEIRGAQCAEERALGEKARALLRSLAGDRVLLRDIQRDKYAGRVVANVYALGGKNLVAPLVEQGVAKFYDGATRLSWCGA